MHGFRRVGSDDIPHLFIIYCGSAGLLYTNLLCSTILNGSPARGCNTASAAARPRSTIESMAADLIEDILLLQPTGPYRLAGWSFGGILAYEVAVQLVGADNLVTFLGILDSPLCTQRTDLHLYRKELDENKRALSCMFHKALSFDGTLSTMRDRHPQIAANVHFDLQDGGMIYDTTYSPTVPKISDIAEYAEASTHYSANSLSIPINLFTNTLKPPLGSLLGWGAVVPRHLINEIPTNGIPKPAVTDSELRSLGQVIVQIITKDLKTDISTPERDYLPLLHLQTGRNCNSPLFCIPGAGASVTAFIELIGCLNRDVPVYGLQPRGIDSLMVPHSTVAAAAAAYCQAIENTVSHRTIHLLGHSFGGWIAFEMAQHFRKVGRDVGSLTIVDSTAPQEETLQWREFDSTQIVLEWVNMIETMLNKSIDIAREDVDSLSHSAQLELMHSRLVRTGLLPRQSSPDSLKGPLRTFASCLRARYQPGQSYTGPASLVVATDPRLSASSNHTRWENTIKEWRFWLPSVTTHYSTGDHFSILKPPHIQGVAAQLPSSLRA